MNTNTKTKATTAYPLVICGVIAAVMVVCSWIAIPLPSGVPINLAVLGVLLSAGCLGFRYGTLTQLVYVLLGCVGLPVFAGFNGGLHVIAGPTGGYIVGYILCAGIVGFIAIAAGMTGDATAADMTAANINTFKTCAFYVPLALIVLSLLVFMFKVKINEKMHAEIVEQLEAKLAAGEIPDEEVKTVETVEASTRRPRF